MYRMAKNNWATFRGLQARKGLIHFSLLHFGKGYQFEV